MPPLKTGGPFFLLLALPLLSCRTSVPPQIEICLGDGFGGADCVERDGTQMYRSPSSLQNYWMTNQVDESSFSQWCYQTTQENVDLHMQMIAEDIKK